MGEDSAAREAREVRRSRIEALGFAYAAAPKREVESCNLCGEARFVVLTHRDRYGYPASAHGCTRCGLVFLNPVMTAGAYAAFYAETYRPLVSAYHGRRIDAETIQAEQADYACERGDLLEPFARSLATRTLLDVGGSTGVVAAELSRRFDLRATVLDPSPRELAHASARGLEAIAGLLESWEPGERRFGLVTLCQTVDHLLDLAGALAKVRRMLAADGLLFADIVDFRAAYLRHWSVEEAVKIDHPYSLTDETMTALLQRGGFEVLRRDYAADHLHVSFVCRPCAPQSSGLPAAAAVEALWREVRLVQNAPAPGAGVRP